MNTWRQQCVLLALLFYAVASPVAAQMPDSTPPNALWIMKMEGVVGPSTADYLVRGLERASETGAAAVLITINTPGGLDSSMRNIVSAILASPAPVICHVAPGGARAASAGTYMLYSCHIAAMASATNLGAATPVAVSTPFSPSPGGDGKLPGEAIDKEDGQEQAAEPKSAMERKLVNDAVAYIRSLAELRGRNADWAEEAVRKGSSLSANRALELGVIDLIASDTESLLTALQGETVEVDGREMALDLESAPRVVFDPDWRSEFLAVITNPNVAYILMLIGVYGLIYEFANPGFGLPGILGLTCLLVALYAFQILPVSYAGLGLMLLGIGLIAAEVMMPSFGIFGIGGLFAFVVGSIMLMDTELPAYQLALPVVVALTAITGALMFTILGMAMRAHRRPTTYGAGMEMGQIATIEQTKNDHPLARYEGELWSVRCDQALKVGDRVKIEKMDGLKLVVSKLEA